MAAEYSPNMTWPMEKLALQKKILGYEGIHVTFENGRRYPSEVKLQVPSPTNRGYTIRVFFYTGDLSGGTNFIGIYYKTGANPYWLQIHLQDPKDGREDLKADWLFETFAFKGKETFAGRALAHDIYSLGFQVESAAYIALSLDETWLKTFHVGSVIFGRDWTVWLHLQSHSVLSFHFSQETSEPYQEPSRGYMNGVPMGVGSYAEYTLIFNGPGRDLQVTQSGSSVTFSAPDTLAPGETVQCILRISFSGYVASTSFDDTPRAMAVSSPQWLEPTFSGDFSLRNAHTHAAD